MNRVAVDAARVAVDVRRVETRRAGVPDARAVDARPTRARARVASAIRPASVVTDGLLIGARVASRGSPRARAVGVDERRTTTVERRADSRETTRASLVEARDDGPVPILTRALVTLSLVDADEARRPSRHAMSAAPNASAMTPEQRDAAFAMAGQEMEYRVELFNKLVGACYEKCIDKKFKEGDLNVGENSCVDRCAAKYWESVAIVGQMLGAQSGAQGGA